MSAGKLTPDRIITVANVWRNMWGTMGLAIPRAVRTLVSSVRSSRSSELRFRRRARSSPSGGTVLKKSEEAQAMDQLADGIIDRHDTLSI